MKKKNEKKTVKPNDKNKSVGRPSKYEDISKRITEIEKLLIHGFTDKELADFLNISESTLNLYKKEYPEFSESLKKAKLAADLKVVRALYERATGYEHDDLFITQYQGEIIEQKIKKHYPPDTAAAFIWLKNRQGWKDKPESKDDEDEENNLTFDGWN